MKKFITLSLCLTMVFLLASCDSGTGQSQNETTDSTSCSVEESSTGDSVTEELAESDDAMKMYESALKNEIKVYDTDMKEYKYLKDCKTPYRGTALGEVENLKHIYMDVDGDSKNELVINCNDTLILRYNEGTVNLYSFTFRNINNLHTDGSFSWNHTGNDSEYGDSKLYFEGSELKSKELWRIVNDGEPNAEYYIGDKQVNREKILEYFEDNPKTNVEFTPIDLTW